MFVKFEPKEFADNSEVIDPSIALSIDEIIRYGMDQTGFIRRFRDQFQAFEIEHGQGLIANQIARETISAISPYTWQKPVNISTIDESLGYNTAMLNKIQKLVESRIANANTADKAHYQGILLQIKTLSK